MVALDDNLRAWRPARGREATHCWGDEHHVLSLALRSAPTANLDTSSARTVMGTLTRLNEELGVTILFVSHDPDDMRYAGRVVRLSDGRLRPEE